MENAKSWVGKKIIYSLSGEDMLDTTLYEGTITGVSTDGQYVRIACTLPISARGEQWHRAADIDVVAVPADAPESPLREEERL